MHSGKVGQSLLRETIDFATSHPDRIAKSLLSFLRHAPSVPAR
jgi:hypothetical protein